MLDSIEVESLDFMILDRTSTAVSAKTEIAEDSGVNDSVWGDVVSRKLQVKWLHKWSASNEIIKRVGINTNLFNDKFDLTF